MKIIYIEVKFLLIFLQKTISLKIESLFKKLQKVTKQMQTKKNKGHKTARNILHLWHQSATKSFTMDSVQLIRFGIINEKGTSQTTYCDDKLIPTFH